MTSTRISMEDLAEIAVAHGINRLQAKTHRAVAAVHRTDWDKTGCLASLATAWRHDELAEECELMEKELSAVLAIAREDAP
jgi:hypothetical protein